jgi:hypothetical protein
MGLPIETILKPKYLTHYALLADVDIQKPPQQYPFREPPTCRRKRCWRALPHTRHAIQNALRAVPGRFLCQRPAALTTLGVILKRRQAVVAVFIEDIFDASPLIQKTDVDEATDVSSQVYLPVKLRPAASNSLDMHLKAEELPMLTAGYLHFGTDVCIRGDDVPLTTSRHRRRAPQ